MAVSFNNIPAGGELLTPLFFAEMDNTQANTSSGGEYRRLIIGQVNDEAAGEFGSLTQVFSTAQAKSLAGTGSMLAAMYARMRANDPAGDIWVLPVQPDAGAAASATIELMGTAGANGTLSLYIAGQRVQVTVLAGDEAATVAADAATAIARATDLPVTVATPTEGGRILTLTAKWRGESTNDIHVEVNRRGTAGGETTPAGLTVTITPMAGGTGQPDMAELLAAVGDEPFEFIVSPWSDAASLSDLGEWMNDASGRWAWSSMLYGHVYAARRGELGELVAAGLTRNDQHITVHGFESGVPQPAWEVAAGYAGRTAVFISADPVRPTQTGVLVGIDPAPAGERFLRAERNILLGYGTATAYFESSYYRIERAVTTYRENVYGQPDNSYLDSETMHQSAAILRFIRTRVTSRFPRHKVADDGTSFGPGNAIVTPSMVRAELISAYYAMEDRGWVENADLFAEYLVVERNADDPNRIDVLFPPDYINQLRVFALLNQFRLHYAAQELTAA